MADEMDELLKDPRITLWGLLVEVHAALVERIDGEIEAAAGVPASWFEVLLRLARSDADAVRMTALAEMLSFTSGGCSKLVDRMEAAGLIRREPDPHDRRVALVALTEQGREVLYRGLRVHVPGVQRHLVDHLTAGQVRQWEVLLRRLRDALTDASTDQ
ncbi:MarR family winged helix-turn-helix transcriptional regulator [Nocardia sp. NPDC049149]|uniref:MarR family winged helix-turn-helix transcriptional regulator n=1 Tax=Nocardia sp. NPDC049149 TaxID=3364315 RepID=UPI0037183DD5